MKPKKQILYKETTVTLTKINRQTNKMDKM